MPLYEYECRHCGHQFEYLVLHSSPAAECPACSAKDLEQLISMFSVDSASIRQNNINSARKANVKVARDKAVADQEAINHHDD